MDLILPSGSDLEGRNSLLDLAQFLSDPHPTWNSILPGLS